MRPNWTFLQSHACTFCSRLPFCILTWFFITSPVTLSFIREYAVCARPSPFPRTHPRCLPISPRLAFASFWKLSSLSWRLENNVFPRLLIPPPIPFVCPILRSTSIPLFSIFLSLPYILSTSSRGLSLFSWRLLATLHLVTFRWRFQKGITECTQF